MRRMIHRWMLALIFAGMAESSVAFARHPAPVAMHSDCVECRGSCVRTEHWYYVAGRITNAERGDVILYKGPGIVSMLMTGFVWSHAGVMLDSHQVRHTAMDMNEPMKVFQGGSFWQTIGRSPYGRVHFHEWQLYDALPGSVTSAVDEDKAFGYEDSSRLASPWRGLQALLKPASAGARGDAVAVTNWLENKNYKYRVHAFYNTSAADESGGNGCSGAIAAATRTVSLNHATPIVDPVTPTEIVSLAVLNLRQGLYDTKVRPMVSAHAKWYVGRRQRDAVAWSLTDQIVNCFLELQGAETGCAKINDDYVWSARQALGLGNYGKPLLSPAVATAPDHLALSGGRNSLSEQRPESLARQADLPHWADKLPWEVADTPSVQAYLPQVNNWEGAAGGPWDGGALVSPRYEGGGWIRSESYHCQPDPMAL